MAKSIDGESTFTLCRTESVPRNFSHKLRGTGQNKWKMASERRTESGGRIRLRQDPPVTADRVFDPTRPVSRGAGKEKWYHGHGLVFWCMDVQRRAGFFDAHADADVKNH